MSEYEIITEQTPVGWTATLEDFDGFPDASGPESFVGRGFTESDAVADLNEQLSNYERDRQADYGDFLYEQQKDRRDGL